MQCQCSRSHTTCQHCDKRIHVGAKHSCYFDRATQAERFWNRVDRSGGPNACWLWTGPIAKKCGHGRAKWYNGAKVVEWLAHRIAWRLTFGPANERAVCHNCPSGDDPRCCNPSHLWLGTQSENARDMATKDRVAHGKDGGKAKLSEEQVYAIRESCDRRVPHRQIAATFGITLSQVSYIGRRMQWRRLPERV